jgi:hypothetical protein
MAVSIKQPNVTKTLASRDKYLDVAQRRDTSVRDAKSKGSIVPTKGRLFQGTHCLKGTEHPRLLVRGHIGFLINY